VKVWGSTYSMWGMGYVEYVGFLNLFGPGGAVSACVSMTYAIEGVVSSFGDGLSAYVTMT
jgi:hypothetical protein